jgi:aryl-phospho-beta-D-glucosidase BglC (GH1 family)
MRRRDLFPLLLAGAASPAPVRPSWGPYRGADTKPTITEEDVRDFASFGGNLLRVTSNPRPLMRKEPPFEIDEANFALLDKLIDAGEKHGVAIVIDPHTTPGTQATTTTGPKDLLWSDFSWHDHLIRLWDNIARRYKDRGKVIAGYDLLNEPSIPNGGAAGTPADWNLLVRKLVKTIRTVDKSHTIIIEPPTIRMADGKYLNRLLGMEYLEAPPDDNVVYSPHMYEPHEFTHQGVQGRPEPVPYPGEIRGKRWDRATIEETLAPVVAFQQKVKAPIFMGEFSAPRWKSEEANRYLRDVIEVCERNGWSWAYHAYRESEIWDAEMDNEDRTRKQRLPSTPRLDMLKSFWRKSR